MNQQIQDRSAIQFTQGFYDGLGYETENDNDVFQTAFKEGKVAIKLEYFSEGNIPVLKRKTSSSTNVDKLYKPMDSIKISGTENEIKRQIITNPYLFSKKFLVRT